MKKLKNGCHFINIDRTEKFQITDPPKVWVSGFFFLNVDGNGISLENQRCKFSVFLNFPLVHFSPRFHFNIYAWLHLKHLCMDIYPTSHLCVVLHFLIFHRLEKVVVGYQISQTGKYGNGLFLIILIY